MGGYARQAISTKRTESQQSPDPAAAIAVPGFSPWCPALINHIRPGPVAKAFGPSIILAPMPELRKGRESGFFSSAVMATCVARRFTSLRYLGASVESYRVTLASRVENPFHVPPPCLCAERSGQASPLFVRVGVFASCCQVRVVSVRTLVPVHAPRETARTHKPKTFVNCFPPITAIAVVVNSFARCSKKGVGCSAPYRVERLICSRTHASVGYKAE